MSRRRLRILAGDIGGTKTFLAVFEASGAELRPVKEGSYGNAGFADHNQIIDEFLEGDAEGVKAAAFGVAGPVEENSVRFTNLPWVISGEALSLRHGFPFFILNDLVATGWGIQLLSKDDLYTLQEGSPRRGNAALIAAGTGLGESILFWDGKRHIPSGSEGGHTDFAPRNRIETALLEELTEVYGHVSYERVLSGPGLEVVYAFLRDRNASREPEHLKRRLATEPLAAVVSDEAINGSDKVCREALDLFVSVYGAEAGNLALKSMAVGGVYVGGGIAPKILPALKSGPFLRSFKSKGRFEPLLAGVPVSVVLNDKACLLGAAAFAYGAVAEGEGSPRLAP